MLFGPVILSAQTTLSTPSLSFGNVVVNTTSAKQTVTLKNKQLIALNITSLAVPGGGYALDPSTTCPNPGSLAAGASCSIAITLTPTAVGSVPAGSLVITTDASNSPQSVPLSGKGVPPAALSAPLWFSDVVVNTISPTEQMSLTNYQTSSLSITSAAFTGPFALDTGAKTTCPLVGGTVSGTLLAGKSCEIGITFDPTVPTTPGGNTSGYITVSDSAANTPQVQTLSGVGILATTLSAASEAFGPVVVGETSAIKSFTLKNNQLAPLTLGISSITPPAGGYAVDPSTTCGSTLAAGATCTIALTLTPTAVGAVPAGSLSIVTTGPASTLTVALTGTGINPTTLSATSEAFGNVVVGETSGIKSFTLKNNQLAPLTLGISSITPPAGGYAVDPSTTCGSTLAAGASCTIALTLTPAALGPVASGSVTIITTTPTSTLSVALTGTGINPTALSTPSLSFGNVVVNTTSSKQTVTLKNNQLAPLNLGISSITPPPGGYAVDPSTTCGSTLAAGATCTIALTLTPTALGAVSPGDSLSIVTTGPASTLSVGLSGAGVQPTTVSGSVWFSDVVVLEPSVTHYVTVKNNELLPLNFTSMPSVTGSEYAIMAPTLPAIPCTTAAPLAGGTTCTIPIVLTPPAAPGGLGAQLSTLTIVSDKGGTQTVSLNGTGILPVTVSPTALSFPAQLVGTTSAAMTVTLTNALLNSNAVHFAGASIAGTNSLDFAWTPGTCSTSLAPGASCTLSVTFTPLLSGTRTATLNINDDASTSPQMVTLAGAGNAPVTVSPMSITNFTAPVGATSPARTITITNNNASTPISITSFQFSGDFQQTSTSCGTPATPPNPPPYTLAAGASCNLTVQFAPTIGGTRDGQLQVNDSALTSPQVVNLSGQGTSPLTVLPASLTFPAQPAGTVSPAKNLTLTNHEVQAETFTLTPTGDYTIAGNNCSGGTIAANSSCTISVAFAPSATANLGPDDGSLIIADSAAIGSPLSVALTGSVGTPQAAVAEVTPGAGAAGTSNLSVVITGNGYTHFSSSSVISFVDTDSSTYSSDITVNSFIANSPNQITASLTLGMPATDSGYGARNITVTTGAETAFLNSAFTIYDPTNVHTITLVNPAFGTQGQTNLNVGLTATDTNFVQGVTFVNFGTGITVNSLSITDATDAVANISISNTTTIGYRTVTMVTGGEYASSSSTAFQINANNAALLSVTPNVEAQGFSGQLMLVATGTHFLPNATQVTIGGVIVGNVQVTSLTTATVDVAVPAGAPLGPENVTVSTGGEIATLANGFTITGSTPALMSVAPASGVQGQMNLSVVITGNAYTSFNAPGTTLLADFTGLITVNSLIANSANQVTANISISPTAPVGTITARLTSTDASQNATIFPFAFAITASSASIVSVTPNNVPQGGQVTLTLVGSNTIWNQAQTTAAFYPEPVATPVVDEINVTDMTDASLNITVPTNTPPGNYPFYLTTGGQVVSASIHVYANTPSLMMSPANGLVPTGTTAANVFTVNFNGQFTSFLQGSTTQPNTLQVIAGAGVTLTNFTVNSPVSATATLTIAAGAATTSRLVTLTTGAQIVTTYFNVTSTPVGLISIEPYHAPQITTLDVAITGLNTHFTGGTTTVLFGPEITVHNISVTDTTHLTVNITTSFTFNGNTTPTTPGWQTVYVNTGTEQVIGSFAVDPPASPTLLSVSPSSAPQGSTEDVTITGSLTNWCGAVSPTCPNPTEAILGAGVTVANLTITSSTTATATISVSPTAPVGGNSVTMITGSEIVGGTGFSVTPSAAYIQSVLPAVQCNFNANSIAFTNSFCGGGSGSGTPWVVKQLQTVTLNVVGVGTHWLQGDTTFNFGPGVVTDQLTISSPTTAQVQITVLSSSPVGFASLTTYTDGEVVTLLQAIDIEEGFPKLLAISPNAGEQGATMTLQVLGRFTSWVQGTTSLSFSGNPGITVTSINVIDNDNLTASITVDPLAYVDYGPCGHVLTVTTGNEQVSTAPILDNFCVQPGAAQIDSISAPATPAGTTGTITITGSATHFTQGVTTVSFGDPNLSVPAGDVVVTDFTHLTATFAASTSATPGFKTVTVTTYGEVASKQFAYTVIPDQATLTEADPYQAEQGAQNYLTPPQTGIDVVLTGQYSHFDSLSTATFGAGIVVNSVTYNSPTQVTANITIDPLSYVGGRTVTVTTPDVSCALMVADLYNACPGGVTTGTGKEIVSASAFTIIPGPAIISQVAVNTGNEGQEIVFNITGENTHWQQNFTQFYIAGGGYDLTINSVIINSATSATVDMNISPTANPGARSIYMVTAGESLTDSGAFVVTGGVPAVAYVSPNSALQGTGPLEVRIRGIYTKWDSTTTISFGPGITVSSFQIDDNFNIEAVLAIASNAQPGYRTVAVITGTQVLTGNFLVTAPGPPPTPYIWYYWPSSGLPGQTFNISFTGSNTHWDPNPITGTQCSFGTGIQVNTCQVLSQTSILANITITAISAQSNLIVFTTGTETESVGFNVVVAQPTLSVVDPGSGIQGATSITVNILGQYTTFDATTTFSFGPGVTVNGPPVILGPTIATANISIDPLATLGGRSVVATTPDAVPIAQVVGGAGFTVTPSLALISLITPNIAKQGATNFTVEVTGQNTLWNGSTVFQFGAGITVTSTQVNSNTDATLTLSVPALAPEGPTYASAITGGQVASINNGFVVEAGTPYLLSSGPGSLPQQSAATFTILAQQTTWSAANPPTVSFGPGVEIGPVNVTSPQSLTVHGSVDATTYVGYRNLTVTNGTQVLGLANAFYVTPGPAVINSVSPATGGQGVNLPAVQINGTNTNWVQGVTTLNFPGVLVNSFTVNGLNSITANITPSDYAAAGQVSVTATTLGEVATGVNVFTISQTQPELLAVVASSAAQGVTENVNLTGDFTHFSSTVSPLSVVNFGPGITLNLVTANSLTSITANITVQPTANLGYRNVTVTTGSEVVSLTNAFNVLTGPAAISGLNPANGGQNTSETVEVIGSQTHFASGVTTASFGGGIQVTGVAVVDALHANVNITIPNSTPLGAYNVTLTTGGEVATILGGFSVLSGEPVISAVSPPTGTQGISENVTLTGLFTHFSGTSVVNFGSGITVNPPLTNVTTTQLTANITISTTATIGSRTVTVMTGGETASITGGFSVLAGVPALNSATPGTAQAGTTANVVIDGVFTDFQAGLSSANFGSGITVNFISNVTTTQLTANITVASTATVGSRDVSVTTNGQTQTLSGGFTVTAGTPVITQINPNFGNPGQTLSVTITGQYTNWVNGTTVASFGSGIIVNTTTVNVPATTLTANITIPPGTALGPADVTTTTGSEVENVPAGFTVQAVVIPPPSVFLLSPGPNVGDMPINSNIIAVFSQPMNRTTINTSTVTLLLTSNPGQGNIPIPGTVTLDATGRVMTFTPNSLLAVNGTFQFEMSNAIKDATGNTFPQYTVDLYSTFTANTTAPTVIAANPPANATGIGTNVTIQLEFSVPMNQDTESGMTVTTGGNPVTGTLSWNSNPYGSGGWRPGNILSFTPTAPLLPNTTYLVSYSSTLADTASNALVPGSFSFTTGSGADTATNSSGGDFINNFTNVGTNFAPTMNYAKPINPIDINTGTLLLYNGDSGKYIGGTVKVAGNGLSATFTPNVPLLPDTYYRFYQAGGSYDADSNTLNGVNDYFTTGAGQDQTAPTVASISPPDTATSMPLNTEVIVHFSAPIDADTVSNSVTLTPSGGSAVVGTTTLSSDMVTLFFVPTSALQPGTVYNVQVSGYSDVVGNAGTTFTSSFTTAASSAAIIVSTGLDGSGNLITTGDTNDPHWFVNGTSTSAKVVAPGNADFYSGWAANGPNSSWIAPNPDSSATAVVGNTLSTTFNLSGSTANLCLSGSWGTDDWGTLSLNGTALLTSIRGWNPLTQFSVPISSSAIAGTNTLTLTWVQADGSYTGFRLQAVIQTCGASYTGGLNLTNAVPAYGTTAVTNTPITLTFNNAIDPATVNSTTLPVMVTWNSNQEIAGNYVVTGNQVVFTPASPFPINTQIWVGAYNGPFDLAGDMASNGYNSYTQLTYFNTNSTAIAASTPFQVMAFAPAANATNVGLRAPVAATFNRSLNLSSINTSDFALFQGDGQTPWCSGGYSHSQDGTTIQFNCGILPSSSIMTALLGTGLRDWQGNGLANNYTSQFTTSQYDYNTNGTIISTRPGNAAGGVNANLPLVLYANLPINPASATAGLEVAQNDVALPGTVQVLDNGYTLVFTPSSPFTAGALIQWWTTGSLTDTTYNTPFNGASGYFYVAASTGTLAPAFQVVSPPNGATIPLNSIFDAQFNVPLNASTVTANTIYLNDSHTGLNVPANYTMPQPNEVRLVPTGAISPNATLYLYITTGLQSSTSVPVANKTDQYFYTSTSNDTTLPIIVSAVPYNGATGVGVNVSPGVVFNKAIDQVSLNSNTFTVTNAGTPLAGSYWFSSNDSRVEFVPNTALPASTPLVMTLNGVLDQVGNPINFSSTFTTGPGPDFTSPTVVWSSVSSNESIPINSAITIQFSESMDVTTFSSSSNLRIYDTLLSSNIAATLSWNATQSVAYLVPAAPLAAGREYSLHVTGGTDLAGNTVQSFEPTFYAEFTSASSAPTVVAFNPLSGQTGLGTNAIIEAQFSGPIDPNTISGVTLTSGGSTVPTSPSFSAANTVLQLVPLAVLAPGTTYMMTVAGVKDPAGNLVGTVTNTFTTGTTYDLTAATAINSNPADNSTVGTNVTPKLVFNKPLNPITVNNSTFRMFLSDSNQFIPLTVTESSNGLEVTMVPQYLLLPSTRYHFQACCAFQDQDGNNGTQIDEYFWTNGGTVSSGPTVTVSPLDGATGIPTNAQVIVMTSAPIDPTTVGQNAIVLKTGGNPVAGTVTVPNAQEIIFAPTSALAPGSTYTVNVNNFADANGNAVVPSTTTFTTGGAVSTSGLTLTGTNIPSGTTGVSPTASIILSFSQILDPTTVNSHTLEVMDGWNSYYGLAGTYTVSGNQVTFTPTSPYPPGATIYVGECGGPTDVLGEVFQNGSCWVQQLVYFKVVTGSPDTTPLTVVSSNPANGATNVRPDTSVSVTFNKSINYSTASGYNSLLWAGQSLQDDGSITMSADGQTMTFNVGALNQGTTYTIQLPAGGISDPSGNALASTYSSSFTVGVNPATGNGSVVSPNPAYNASGVPTDTLLTLYVNRPANPSTLDGNVNVTVNGAVYAGTLAAPADGYEVQFTPTTPFPNSATVQWWFSGVSDVYGDAFNGQSGVFYTAAAAPNPATAQPVVVAVSPIYGTSTNVPTNAVINLEFSQPLDPSTVNNTNVYFYISNNEMAVVTQPFPNVIRVMPSSPYTLGTTYYVCANSSVKGANGVAIPGNCWTTYFKPTYGPDSTSGTVTIGPPNGVVNVGTNAYIRLEFSKPVDQTTLNSTNVQITNANTSAAIPGTWSYNIVSSNVMGANFSPVNPLPPSTPINVAVSGLLLDYAGNAFNSPTAQFTTAALPDYTTPTVSFDFPSGATGIGTNASFTCHYSEPMDPSSIITPADANVYSYAAGTTVSATYTFSADMMSMTITPTAPLSANAEYNYNCYSAIDLTGNAQSNGTAYFYTGNGPVTTGPVLVQANPPNGFTNVPLNTNGGPWYSTSLMLLFSEPVAGNSLGSITLTPQGGSPMPIGVYAEDGNYIAVVQLPSALQPNTQYTFNVAGVTDYNGNPASGPTTSTFTTGSSFDFTSPTAPVAFPANNATSVPDNTTPSVTFNEAMNPVLITSSQIYMRTHNTQTTVPATVSISADYKTVTITPTTTLAAGTIYDILYWPNNWYLYDIAGNSDGNYGVLSTFTTQ